MNLLMNASYTFLNNNHPCGYTDSVFLITVITNGKLQLDGSEWRTFHKGKGLDNLSLLLEEPLRSRRIRLQVLSFESDVKEQGPALSVFDLFTGK